MAISQVSLQTKFSDWKDITNAIINAVGDKSTLNTSQKANLVGAVNELKNSLGQLPTLNSSAKSSIVAAINEVISNIGTMGNIDSSLTGANTVVKAINAVTTKMGNLTTLGTNQKASLVVAINEVNQDLTDSVQGIGQSINGLSDDVGNLPALSTTDQSNLVGAINEVATSTATTSDAVGEITALSTTDQSNLVSAINELVASRLEAINIPLDNKLTNRGRFATESGKVASTFDSGVEQLTVFNSTVVTEGDRYIDDNSNYGGAGGTLGTDIGSLMVTLESAGRTDARNGFEFFIADYAVGGGTSNGESFTGDNYYPFLTGSDDYLGAIGSTVTFQAWVRVKSLGDAVTYNGILLGSVSGVDTVIDGVQVDPQSALEVSSGWVHIRQTTVLTTEFKKFYPAIYANNGDVVQVALPAMFNADVNGIHLGVM